MKSSWFNHADTPRRTLKNSASLIFGTASSQILIAASIPLVTRLYSVSELGTSAVLISFFSTLSIVGCLRYEIAIPLPIKSNDADILVRSSIIISSVFALMICIALYLFIKIYNPNFADISPFGLFIAAAYFHATSLMSVGNMTSVRGENYARISRARLLVVITQIPVQLVLGLFGANTVGLLMGFTAANYAAGSYLLFGWFQKDSRPKRKLSQMRHVLTVYKGYPLHTSLASLLNTLSLEAPILYFGIRYSTSRAGYVGMVQMGVAVPLSLISSSIGLAIYGEWSREKLQSTEQKTSLRNQTKWILKRVAFVSIVYLSLVVLLSHLLATTLLGGEWYRLWAYVMAIGPFYAAAAVSNPTGWLLELFNETQTILMRSLFRFFLVVLTVLLIEILKPDTLVAAALLSIYGMFASIAFIIFSTRPLRRIDEE